MRSSARSRLIRSLVFFADPCAIFALATLPRLTESSAGLCVQLTHSSMYNLSNCGVLQEIAVLCRPPQRGNDGN